MSRTRYLLLLLSLALAACGGALTSVVDLQSAMLPEGSLSAVDGLILDPSGARLGGAVVSIQLMGTKAPVSVASDAQGRFAFKGLAAGEYEMDIRHKDSGARVKHLVVPFRTAIHVTVRTSPGLNLKSTTSGTEAREGKDRIKEVHNY